MVKPGEREALAGWWRATGVHFVKGMLAGFVAVGLGLLPAALLIGFTVN